MQHILDMAIYYRVRMILAELELIYPVSVVDDYDPDYSTRDIGPHRLYRDFHLEARDDVDTTDLVANFCVAMDRYNKISPVKADFYEANEYPGPVKNWHTVYLTVATI